MSKIYPVLLAGGSGTRLWPLSRKSYPNHVSNIIGDVTLFQSTAQRLTSSETLEFASHITLTNADHRFIIGKQQNIFKNSLRGFFEPKLKKNDS